MADAEEGVVAEKGELQEGEEEKEPENIPGTGTSDVASKLPQVLGASVAMLGGFTLGVATGWTSSAFYINKNLDDSDQEITRHESYIGGLMPVGGALVMFLMYYVLDIFGRKITMLGLAPLCATSFIIPGVFYNYICWIVMRVVMGFSCAAFCVAAPIYVGEIAEKDIRGTLGSLFQLLLTVGILYAYILGITGNMWVFAILTALAPCVFFVCFFFFPETPSFLMLKGKEDAAIKSLQWYRGKDYNITTEFLEIKRDCQEEGSTEVTPKDLIATKSARKSLLISLGLMFFQQLSGINVVMFYATDVFASAGTTLDPIYCSIILGVVQIFATLTSTLLIDRLGRKILLYISLAGMVVCLFALGGWYIYIGINKPSAILGFLPLVIINLYLVFFSLGDGPVPWVMIGELFPKEIKGMSGSLSGLFNWSLACFVTVSFEPMSDALGSAIPFFMYGVICFLGIIFVFFLVIETKGKSLSEIQDELNE